MYSQQRETEINIDSIILLIVNITDYFILNCRQKKFAFFVISIGHFRKSISATTNSIVLSGMLKLIYMKESGKNRAILC